MTQLPSKDEFLKTPARFFLITNALMWACTLPAARFCYQPRGTFSGLVTLRILAGLFSPLSFSWCLRRFFNQSADQPAFTLVNERRRA